MNIEELSKPLDRANVKTRDQGNAKLSYIESWHAIAEANRIFGFDEWNRETVELVCLCEKSRKIGKGSYERDGWGVTYRAKVRVKVGDVVREGSGAGHGIDADLGLAHESALKEAESDAMKRALMTFGNPFGLALYDKEQTNVVSAPPPQALLKASSASQKKGLLDIDADLTDCHSILDVDKCAKVWAELMKRDGWAKDFVDIARPKFQARRDEIHTRVQFEADAAEQFQEQQEAAE